MTAKLVIYGRLPGLNDYIAAERTHRHSAAKMKRGLQANIKGEIAAQLRGVRFAKPVSMRYTWFELNRRRDKDNVSAYGRKVIQDALVDAGILGGDGWQHIDGFSDSFEVDPKNPRIEVIITEVGL